MKDCFVVLQNPFHRFHCKLVARDDDSQEIKMESKVNNLKGIKDWEDSIMNHLQVMKLKLLTKN